MSNGSDVVIIDDEGLLSPKDGEEFDVPVGDTIASESLDSPTTTLEEAQAFGIALEATEENPQPLDIAGDFAKKTEH
ncbi:MAG: hypothetical protein Q8Q15_03760 [bacterium]|nr:hypothetical protein [bacterium]